MILFYLIEGLGGLSLVSLEAQRYLPPFFKSVPSLLSKWPSKGKKVKQLLHRDSLLSLIVPKLKYIKAINTLPPLKHVHKLTS